MYETRASFPGGGQGVWRGSDILAGGSGSGMGQANQGTGLLSQGLGPIGSMAGDWEPSIWYMLGLVVAELVVFHVVGRMLR